MTLYNIIILMLGYITIYYQNKKRVTKHKLTKNNFYPELGIIMDGMLFFYY